MGAFLFGLAAAAVSTGLWVWWDAHATFGFLRMSWFVGVAIALGVTLGGRGRTSLPIVVLSVLLTALSLVIGEYLIISYGIASAFNAHPNAIVVADPKEVLTAFPKVLLGVPLRPLLWVVALAAAFLGPWGRLVGPSPSRR
jgi:hypothetical protein